MPQELLSSKVVIIEEEPTVRGIPSAPTSVAGAVGITERGPIGKAELVTSFEEFQQKFGGFTPDSDLALAAMGFFENGGSQLWVVRTVHYGDVSDASSATAVRASGTLVAPGGPTPASVTSAPGPFALAHGDRIDLVVNGVAAQVSFTATPARVLSENTEPFAVADGQTLTVRVDGGIEQTVVFQSPELPPVPTAAAIAAIIDAALVGASAEPFGDVVSISSDTLGPSSQLEITGGTANAALGFPTTPVVGEGNVPDITAVTPAQAAAVVAAEIVDVEAVPGTALTLRTLTTGPTATIQVAEGTSGAFGFDFDLHTGSETGPADVARVEGKDPGAYANRIEIEVRQPASGAAGAFDLFVIDDGVFRETFPSLSMNPADARHIERIVNDLRTGSILIRVTDLLVPGAPVPGPQIAQLSGGDNGLAGLGDIDFIGSEPGKTGLSALDTVQELSVLLVPGRATPAVHIAMLRYAELDRDGSVFAVLDPPANQGAADMVTYVTTVAALENLSEFGAIYWPRVKVLNPARSVFGNAEQIVVPPSGIIAGVYARTDAARPGGVYDSPAGIEKGRMFGVLGFETDEVLEERKRDVVYPRRINPLTTGPGLPRFIDGSRTLQAIGQFPFIGERRGVIFIERSIKAGLQFARHRNNTESLRAEVRRTISSFLVIQMNNGAFRSNEPAKAFFIDLSLNTPSVIFAGKLIVRIGLATNKPAEFVIVRISQDTRALDEELATGA